VIAGARQDRVKSLVFIAALAPDQGETVQAVPMERTEMSLCLNRRLVWS
jgi:hypothetical protein